MEDALISPIGFAILSGAGLIEASKENTIKQHTTETTNSVKVDGDTVTIALAAKPYMGKEGNDMSYIYVMLMNGDDVVSEPYIPASATETEGVWTITLKASDTLGTQDGNKATAWKEGFVNGEAVLVDYYIERESGAQQIEITPDKFGGNYYLEASTLFRDTNGVDMPAEFIIPNCKIQSNFTFAMASSGDPSTFSFVMDAFPDYTRFDNTKKVLAAIQIISAESGVDELTRLQTQTTDIADPTSGIIVRP